MSDDLIMIFRLLDELDLTVRLGDVDFEIGPTARITPVLGEMLRNHSLELHRELGFRERMFERAALDLTAMERRALGAWWKFSLAERPAKPTTFPPPPTFKGGDS